MSLSQNKVTDNTHEMSFYELMSQSAQLRVPLFQRPYVWAEKQLKRMVLELDSIIDGEDSNRFLGAIIAVRRMANPADPQPYEIVDGQQRLTTLYLFILAAALVSARNGDIEYATALVNSNLIVPWSKTIPNTKLVPSSSDRGQLKNIYSQLFAIKGLLEWLPETVRLPEVTGDTKGKLEAQFSRIRKLLERRSKEHGAEALKNYIEAARTRLTFVFILLKDPSTATTVFEGLNDPGVPIGVGDLVKMKFSPRLVTLKRRQLPYTLLIGCHFRKNSEKCLTTTSSHIASCMSRVRYARICFENFGSFGETRVMLSE